MRIVYCIPSISNSGGMERVLSVKANYLQSEGNQVYIITTDQKRNKPFFKISSGILVKDLGINYIESIGKNILIRFVEKIKKRNKHKKLLFAYLKQIDPDIIISMFNQEADILYKYDGNSKKIIESHFNYYIPLYRAKGIIEIVIAYFRMMYNSWLVTKYDKFIVLTQEDRMYWNKKNIEVIPNPITINNIIDNTVSNLKLKQVISVGRISYQKGFDRLIKVWAIVNEQVKDWNLVIIGNCDNKKEVGKIEKLISLYKLKNVIIKEPLSSIEQEFSKSKLFVSTSRYEGLPLVMIESMAFGLPCISFDCKCGPKDIIMSNINGYLVRNDDIEGMANRIIYLLKEPSLLSFMGANARNKSFDYTENKIMIQWKDLFNSLMK